LDAYTLRVPYHFHHYHHPALLRRYAAIPDRLLAFFMALSTLVLKLPFPQSFALFTAIYPFLRLILGIMATRSLAVTGGGGIGKCGRLSQPS